MTRTYPSPNPGGHFLFAVGERLTWTPRVSGYPPRRVRVVRRTIEAALGKTYQVRDCQTRKLLGYIPESDLTKEK